MAYLNANDETYVGPDPMLYRLHALQFASAAKQLIDQSDNGEIIGMAAIPVAFLLCHSMEMSLKLALMKNSFPENELKKLPLRHNLSELLLQCGKLHIDFSQQQRIAINALSDAHSKHVLRYTAMSEGFWIPMTLKEVCRIAFELLMKSHPSALMNS